MDIKQLRKDYEELVDKKPWPGWSEEKIEEKMEAFRSENNITEVVITEPVATVQTADIKEETSVVEHGERYKNIRKLERSQIYKQLMNLEPVFLKEVPHAIIGNKYVLWEEAEVIKLTMIKNEIEQLIKEKTAKITS